MALKESIKKDLIQYIEKFLSTGAALDDLIMVWNDIYKRLNCQAEEQTEAEEMVQKAGFCPYCCTREELWGKIEQRVKRVFPADDVIVTALLNIYKERCP